MTKWLAFDLEIAKDIPEGETDWKAHRPLGITCAAVWAVDWPAPKFWQGVPALNREGAAEIVTDLIAYWNEGYTIVTWNGLGFDFDVLAEESGNHDDCVELALGHVDMMFQLFCVKGFPLGIDAAAKGQGIPGKPEGMSGAKAPAMWAAGEYQQVLAYLAHDVEMTALLAEACERKSRLTWTSKSGRPQTLMMPKAWLTVNECLRLPVPDTSWMSDPWPREKFTAWMETEPQLVIAETEVE